MPLIEIVSEPEMRSAEEAATFFERLRQMLVWLGVNDGNMDEGSLRCDANVSVRPVGTTTLGTKTEVKNVNSFRYLQKAIEFEIGRHIDVLDHGGRIVQETRLFDAAQGKTYSMRSKEEAHDYRYFPEPDLPPLTVDESRREALRAQLPELPEARSERFQSQYGLPAYDAELLTQTPRAGGVLRSHGHRRGQRQGGQQLGDGRGAPDDEGTRHPGGARAPLAGGAGRPDPDRRAGHDQQHRRQGRVREDVRLGPFGRRHRRRRTAWRRSPIPRRSSPIVQKVVDGHPEVIAEIRAGKDRKFQFLVGQVMKESRGKADPKVVTDLLKKAIG